MKRRSTLKFQRFLLVLVKASPFGTSLSLFIRFVNWRAVRMMVGIAVVGAASLVVVQTAPVSAAAWTDGDRTFEASQIRGEILDHQLYYYAASCAAIIDIDSMSEEELKSWEWFKTAPTGGLSAVRGAMYDNPYVECKNGNYLKEAFERFGLADNPYDAFCSLDVAYSRNGGGLGDGSSESDCTNAQGRGDYDASGSKSEQRDAFKKLFNSTSKGQARQSGGFPDYAKYLRAYLTFDKACEATYAKAYTTGEATNDPRAFRISMVLQDGSVVDVLANTPNDNDGKRVMLVATESTSRSATARVNYRTCGELAQDTVLYADAYAAWLQDPRNAGAEGSTEYGEARDEGGGSTTTCAIDGIGWIICPVLVAGGNVADEAFGFLSDNFLQTDPSLLATTGDTNGTYVAWTRFRDLANVAFVIVFLFMIYSQLTGLGLSNYGIKKLAPKLVLVAIMVNSSFWLCAIAVDLSNILGYSIRSLFDGLASGMVTTPDNIDTATANTGSGWGWAGIVVLVLGAAGFTWLALGALVPMLLAALVALAMILFILLARKALIVLLIAIAPLAFVAFLLPNTSKWFDKWRQAFVALLMVFPVIAVVFGASTMAAAIVKSSGDSTLNQIMAAGIAIVPLFVVPSLLKGSLNAVGSLGGKLNGLGSKASGFASKKGADKWGKSGMAAARNLRNENRADRKARIKTGNFNGRGGLANPRNLRSRLYGARNQSALYNTASGGYGAQQVLKAQGQNAKDTKEAIDMFRDDDVLISAWANDGGSQGAAYASLSGTQRQQYDQMRAAGHHRKATSHMAAVQALSESGKGDAAQITSALAHAASAGSSANDQESARQAAIVAYRKSGRGDAVGDLTGGGRTAGWGQVAAESVHREGITQDGGASFGAYLNADSENTRKALAGFDKMEARAQAAAQGEIIAAAQAHQYAATGVAPTISGIQEAKDYYGVK